MNCTQNGRNDAKTRQYKLYCGKIGSITIIYCRIIFRRFFCPMSDETQDTENPAEAKPTITIAEKEGTAAAASHEDVSYQAVEKDGSVTAIWEMQGHKHLRTIDPRSAEGKQILALFETAG
jgi:hypothetical protein